MSVLTNIATDYHGESQTVASKALATVTAAIKRAIASGERSKRTIGELLNAVVASDILIAAEAEIDGDGRNWSDDNRATALSAYISKCGISKDDASAWRKYADGEAGRELAGISKPAAVSAYRDIAAGTPVADIAAMLKDAFTGDDAPAMTRKAVAEAADDAGIGTPAAAGSDSDGGDAPVADSELQTTPAQARTALVNQLLEMHADGVRLTLTECKSLEAMIADVRALKAVA